jgi:hypothetical protein
MRSDENQRLAFEFLRARFRDQAAFEREEFQRATGWRDSTFETYWLKHFRELVVSTHGSKLRVGEPFRRYATWERFQQHVTQVRHVSSDYSALAHDNIIVFEFFMPLAHEEHLRTSLDALFYKDAVLTRLRTIDPAHLAAHFPRSDGESEDLQVERVARWIGDHFVGYSIGHVSGRFRLGPFGTMADAVRMQSDGDRYLADETTAVVRFIFPCGKPRRLPPPLSSETFEGGVLSIGGLLDIDAEDEATKIRWAFGVLFVQSIVQIVNGEAEIWMVESGMRSRLHIWRVESEESS